MAARYFTAICRAPVSHVRRFAATGKDSIKPGVRLRFSEYATTGRSIPGYFPTFHRKSTPNKLFARGVKRVRLYWSPNRRTASASVG